MTGFAPIVAHPAIMPVYESDEPKNQSIRLEVDVALVKLVAGHPLGQIWILVPDNHTLSAGMLMEVEAWVTTPGSGKVMSGQWDWWQRRGARSKDTLVDSESTEPAVQASTQNGSYTLDQLSDMLTREGFKSFKSSLGGLIIGTPEDHANCFGPFSCCDCDQHVTMITLNCNPPDSPKPIRIGWSLFPDQDVDFTEAISIIEKNWQRQR
jgi:hypothetical protein